MRCGLPHLRVRPLSVKTLKEKLKTPPRWKVSLEWKDSDISRHLKTVIKDGLHLWTSANFNLRAAPSKTVWLRFRLLVGHIYIPLSPDHPSNSLSLTSPPLFLSFHTHSLITWAGLPYAVSVRPVFSIQRAANKNSSYSHNSHRDDPHVRCHCC